MTLRDWLIIAVFHAIVTWLMLAHFLNKARTIFLDIIKSPDTMAAIREAVMSQLPAPFAALMRKD